jgi:monofunctional biosynthetic peptidoglycan transglycosylase
MTLPPLNAHGPDTPNWWAVNDGVMGGISTGAAIPLDGGVIRFAGILSLENRGGFASIRADSPAFAFEGEGTLILEVIGDGRSYTIDLRTRARQGAFSYKQGFETTAGERTTHRLPLSAFRATAYGRRMPLALPLNPAKVMSLGFMLYDGTPGPFRLDILSITFEPAP